MLIELCPMVLNGGIVKNPYPKIFHRLALIVPAWFPDYFCRTFKSNKAVDVWKVGSLRKTNKQTCNAICVCACVCVGRWGRNQVDFCQFVIHCWYICDVFATWLVFGYGYVLVECFWLTLNFFLFFKHVLNKCIFYSAAFDHRVFTVIEIRNISALYFSSNSYLCSNTTICSMCLIWSSAVEALAKVHSLFCGRTVDL